MLASLSSTGAVVSCWLACHPLERMTAVCRTCTPAVTEFRVRKVEMITQNTKDQDDSAAPVPATVLTETGTSLLSGLQRRGWRR